MNSFGRLHLQCCATKSLFHTLLQPLLHEAAKVIKQKVVLLCRQCSLAKNGLNSRADDACFIISALKQKKKKKEGEQKAPTLPHPCTCWNSQRANSYELHFQAKYKMFVPSAVCFYKTPLPQKPSRCLSFLISVSRQLMEPNQPFPGLFLHPCVFPDLRAVASL